MIFFYLYNEQYSIGRDKNQTDNQTSNHLENFYKTTKQKSTEFLKLFGLTYYMYEMINDNTLTRSIYRARVSRAGLKPHIGVENLRKQKLKYVKNTLFGTVGFPKKEFLSSL